MAKYIFVTGGVCSSLGKGIATASIGALLKSAGLEVFTQKLDPYLNVDPGTMSPFQHGEVFVTHDGAETDLDLGHYERFIDVNLTKESSVTTGKVYTEVLNKERKGDFLGGTIQIIPHITNAIKHKIKSAAKNSKCDVMLVEIGGTTGDIEGLPYLEAIRQLRHELGRKNTLFVHLTLLPYLAAAKELKTKPTQASVREMRSIGIQPDIILARADQDIPQELINKIALFCDVDEKAVIPAPTVNTIYEVPSHFYEAGLGKQIAQKLGLEPLRFRVKNWRELTEKIANAKKEISIALVGKYTGLDDAYLSVIESLKIACFHNNHKLKLNWVSAEKLETLNKKTWDILRESDGILVPGGFGSRGIEGKILAAKYAREHKVPYLGICLGMQIMTIEFARDVLNNKLITSQEFDEEAALDPANYVIHFLEGQSWNKNKGGTLRLGAFPCHLKPGTKIAKLFGKPVVEERHRHRYEFNNSFMEELEKHGLIVSGIFKEKNLVEMVEIKGHPYMVGTQSHPEFLSRPHRPHPLFKGLIDAAIKNKK
ncbi:CTP synthetase [Candidatus Peregrinibacteria bacterium CG11_big_fil_rev_8_21_14_0_20_41_10]|nr:MAG: CTP synthetase [Candidatus Peregrinibacteria bacterium CG11_big_fil_rev_8_21_14_0_20_41_10]PIZ74550.1 MAG: CTP synthase [Candidatus Peregrinibacteria bacterium CG_4_10_14_0_2_um_filter_41_8]PJC38150.1 MAG: CTP synthase [Candidatus Peregrinibacteria bacterium CG_4_9_14_0_2_um_filter_41_14]